jgi:hypothetical protein
MTGYADEDCRAGRQCVGDYDHENPPPWDRYCAWAMLRCPTGSDQNGLVPVVDPDEKGRVLWAHSGCVDRECGDHAPALLKAGAQRARKSEMAERRAQRWDDDDEL